MMAQIITAMHRLTTH